MERTLRNAEQMANKLMEESGLAREFGSVHLYRQTQSKALSMELDKEFPKTLGSKGSLLENVPLGRDGGKERGRNRRRHQRVYIDGAKTPRFPRKKRNERH